MKNYTNKSNATRAMNTYAQKVQEYLVEAIVSQQAPKEFAVEFEMQAGTPAEMVEMLQEKFIVEVRQPEPVEAPAKGTGIKIEKNREEQNGYTRPSKGGVCAKIWEMLDEYQATNNTARPIKDVKEWAQGNGVSTVTASVQYYQWRRHNGYRGRV